MAEAETELEFRGIAHGALLFAAFAAVLAIIDFVTAVLPLSPTVAGWRYTSTSALSGYLGLPVAGALGAGLAARYLGSARLASGIGMAALVIAGLLVIAWVVFLIDAFSVRGGSTGAGRASGDVGMAQTSAKLVFYALALFLLGRVLRKPAPDDHGK